jgi:hypothetical protein
VWEVRDRRHRADHDVIGATGLQSDELMVVVLLRVVRALRLIDVGLENAPVQLLGGRAVGHPAKGHQQASGVMTARLHGEGPAVAEDRRPGSEPAIGLVGTDLDVQLTANAMGATDAADDDQHR